MNDLDIVLGPIASLAAYMLDFQDPADPSERVLRVMRLRPRITQEMQEFWSGLLAGHPRAVQVVDLLGVETAPDKLGRRVV
jgi:hypothetical protein